MADWLKMQWCAWLHGGGRIKREWVGLTDEDKSIILQHKWWDFEDEFDLDGLLKLVEAKLKEKNNG